MSLNTRSSTLRKAAAVDDSPSLHSLSSASSIASLNSSVDAPRHSPSTTSLSSLDSSVEDKAEPLIDGYGNEFEVPDFTIKQIRDAIPAHCYERSALKSLYYVARDLVSLATTFYIFSFVTPENVPSFPLRCVLWTLYTVLNGMFGTGLWIMAHEAGHGAFSESTRLNDFVGWVCHSIIMVPFFSWKLSHSKHHKATGHIENDMAFVPYTREEYAKSKGVHSHKLTEMTEDMPIVTLGSLIFQQLVGWPAYLMANASGHDNHERQREGKGKGKHNGLFGGVNHYFPSSPLYEKKDERAILYSDLGLAIVGTALYFVGKNYGWTNMMIWYGGPWLWVNHWIVMLTYLQHTDPSLPHYDAKTWTFARGAAATIDREFGFIGRQLFHGIIETHVLHHYVSTIPFYNADEATEAIKPIMGRHYRSDTKDGSIGFLKALWRTARYCQWVEPSSSSTKGEGVLFFRNNNGLGTKPIDMTVSDDRKVL